MSDKTTTEPSARDAIRKTLKQVLGAEQEINRLKLLQQTLQAQHKQIIESGEIEDPNRLGEVTVINTKLAMIPHKIRQLSELRSAAVSDLPALIQRARHENDTELSAVRAIAMPELEAAVRKALAPLLPGATGAPFEGIVDDIINRSSVGIALISLNAWAGQKPYSGDPRRTTDDSNIAEAKDVIWFADRLDAITEHFIVGSHLDLKKVAATPISKFAPAV
jgi:hypothetical protein